MKAEQSKFQAPLDPEEMQLQKLFPEMSRRELLEGLAMSHILNVYRICIEWRASEQGAPVSEVVDEWYHLCLEGPAPGEHIQHGELLDKALSFYKANFPELTSGSSWKDLIATELGKWDQLIDFALEHGWGFVELRNHYRGDDHFKLALEHGADPSISSDALTELIKQTSWEKEHSIRQSLGLSPGTSWETVQEIKEARWRETQQLFAKLLRKDPDQITVEDINDFMKRWRGY